MSGSNENGWSDEESGAGNIRYRFSKSIQTGTDANEAGRVCSDDKALYTGLEFGINA